MTNTTKRLIEHTLPLQAVSEQLAREKSIRYGHISTFHILWVRRPLAAMRAAIFAAFVPAPENAERRKELGSFVAEIVAWGQVRLVVQTLIILPDGDAECLLLESFLAGREVLPEVGWQDRLF